MKTKRKISFLPERPSWVLAILTSITSTFITLVYVIIYAFFTFAAREDEIIGSTIIPVALYFSIIIVMNFFIVRRDPHSVWYVPVICNAILILVIIRKSNIWNDPSVWIPICGGLILSIIAGIIGAIAGKRYLIPDPQEGVNHEIN